MHLNLLLSIAAILIDSANGLFRPFIVLATVDLLVFSFVGAVIASRESRNPIGWILLAVGLGITFANAGTNYGKVAQRPGAVVGRGRELAELDRALGYG